MALIKCSECGKEISDKATACPGCGVKASHAMQEVSGYEKLEKSGPTPSRPPYIETHLAKSIIVTLLCCLPFGIAAIVQAASVSGKLQAGDYAAAKIASDKANSYSNFAIGSGIAAGVLWFMVIVLSSR